MKKGIIITIILVVIAVVLAIVFINLFRERDTVEMANRVISAVYDGYLDDAEEEGEYETINEYLDNLIAKESELTQEQRNEVRNFKNVYVTYALIADFYSKQIIFTEYNDVYKEYKSYVMDGLNNSSNSANNMVNYILENSEGEVQYTTSRANAAYKKVESGRKEIEKTLYKNALVKVRKKHPTWQLVLKDVKKDDNQSTTSTKAKTNNKTSKVDDDDDEDDD